MANSARVMHKIKGAKRLEGESFPMYKERMKRENQLLKNYMKGEIVWYPGGKLSTIMLLRIAYNPENRLTIDVAKKIINSGKGTLRGKSPKARRESA